MSMIAGDLFYGISKNLKIMMIVESIDLSSCSDQLPTHWWMKVFLTTEQIFQLEKKCFE